MDTFSLLLGGLAVAIEPANLMFAFIVWFMFAKGLQLSLPTGFLERLLTTGSFQ